MAVAAQKAPEAPRKIFLPASGMDRIEFKSTAYWVTVPEGHTPDDLLNPEYWAHNARRIRGNSLIYVRATDGSFDGILMCVAASDGWAKMQWFLFNSRTEKTPIDPTPERQMYKIDNHAGNWRVIHRDTAAVLVKDLPRRIDAEKWIDSDIEQKRK